MHVESFVAYGVLAVFHSGVVRKKRSGRGGQEYTWSVKCKILLSTKNKVVMNSNAFK